MEGLNWPGILFFVFPVVISILGLGAVVTAEIVVQAIVITNKIRRRRFWVKK